MDGCYGLSAAVVQKYWHAVGCGYADASIGEVRD